MILKRTSRLRALGFHGVLAGLATGVLSANAQQFLEPQALRLQVTAASLGVRIDAQSETTTYTGAGGTATYERLFMGPVFGLNATGSVYHPNLLTISLGGELSPGYEFENFGAVGPSKRTAFHLLGNYQANFVFLSSKPYGASISLSQNYTYRDYDFFNRVEVNSMRYGATLGYQAGRVPFTINVWQRDEQTYGQTNDTSLQETGVTFDARNTRETGESTFNYTYTNSNRRDYSAQATDEGYAVGLGDTETFGSRQQFHLSTNAGYSTRQSFNSPTDDTTASAVLTVDHSPTLSSIYDANYYGSSANSTVGSADSVNFNGGASLRHKLYESLTSTLRIQGLDYSSDGSFADNAGVNTVSTSNTMRFGGGVTEQYTKRLGSIGRLSIVGSLMVEHSVVDNGGDMLIQTDERHAFSSGSGSDGSDSFFLNLPYVDESSIVITDDHNNFPAYQEGLDYTVSNNGSLTMIRRTATSNIPQNSTVLVDYRAKATGSGEYNTVTGLLNVRVDLWNGLAAVYGRYNSVQNSGAPMLVLQDMNVYAVGLETTWRWLHAGMEYEAHDSTFSSYQDTRLFEGLAFKPDAASTLNFDLIESQTRYIDAARSEQNYSFMSRYQRGLRRNLGAHLEAGFAVRRGEGVDQTLFAVRPGFEWNIGHLEIKTGYSFEYGKYPGSDQRVNQLLFFSARRNF